MNEASTLEVIPGGSDDEETACNVGDLSLIPGSGISLGGENGNPLQYSSLENPMNREAWQDPVFLPGKSHGRET